MDDPKITVRQKIIDLCRKLDLGDGELLSQQAIDGQLVPSLSAEEKTALAETLQEMVSDDVLRPGDGGGYLLTENAEDQVLHIYA